MDCPVCHTPLDMTERAGVEIDYCPRCRGVWLDRGELDKIVERSVSGQRQNSSDRYAERQYESEERHEKSHHHDDEHGHGEGYGKKRKRESFLGDLFDF